MRKREGQRVVGPCAEVELVVIDVGAAQLLVLGPRLIDLAGVDLDRDVGVLEAAHARPRDVGGEPHADRVARRGPREVEAGRHGVAGDRRSARRRARAARGRPRDRGGGPRRAAERNAPGRCCDMPPPFLGSRLAVGCRTEGHQRERAIPPEPRDLPGRDPGRGAALRRAPGGRRSRRSRSRPGACSSSGWAPARPPAGSRARYPGRRGDRPRLAAGDGLQGARAGDRGAPGANGGPAARRALGPRDLGALRPPPRPTSRSATCSAACASSRGRWSSATW